MPNEKEAYSSRLIEDLEVEYSGDFDEIREMFEKLPQPLCGEFRLSDKVKSLIRPEDLAIRLTGVPLEEASIVIVALGCDPEQKKLYADIGFTPWAVLATKMYKLYPERCRLVARRVKIVVNENVVKDILVGIDMEYTEPEQTESEFPKSVEGAMGVASALQMLGSITNLSASENNESPVKDLIDQSEIKNSSEEDEHSIVDTCDLSTESLNPSVTYDSNQSIRESQRIEHNAEGKVISRTYQVTDGQYIHYLFVIADTYNLQIGDIKSIDDICTIEELQNWVGAIHMVILKSEYAKAFNISTVDDLQQYICDLLSDDMNSRAIDGADSVRTEEDDKYDDRLEELLTEIFVETDEAGVKLGQYVYYLISELKLINRDDVVKGLYPLSSRDKIDNWISVAENTISNADSSYDDADEYRISAIGMAQDNIRHRDEKFGGQGLTENERVVHQVYARIIPNIKKFEEFAFQQFANAVVKAGETFVEEECDVFGCNSKNRRQTKKVQNEPWYQALLKCLYDQGMNSFTYALELRTGAEAIGLYENYDISQMYDDLYVNAFYENLAKLESHLIDYLKSQDVDVEIERIRELISTEVCIRKEGHSYEVPPVRPNEDYNAIPNDVRLKKMDLCAGATALKMILQMSKGSFDGENADYD